MIYFVGQTLTLAFLQREFLQRESGQGTFGRRPPPSFGQDPGSRGLPNDRERLFPRRPQFDRGFGPPRSGELNFGAFSSGNFTMQMHPSGPFTDHGRSFSPERDRARQFSPDRHMSRAYSPERGFDRDRPTSMRGSVSDQRCMGGTLAPLNPIFNYSSLFRVHFAGMSLLDVAIFHEMDLSCSVM